MKTLQERFDEKWKLDPVTGCWLWTAHRQVDGYGTIGAYGLSGQLAHRVSYALRHGTGRLPRTVYVRHTCANAGCVNPSHLYTCNAVGEAFVGEANPRARITESDVSDLRRMRASVELSIPTEAKARGVDRETIASAVDGRKWSHIPGVSDPVGYASGAKHYRAKLTDTSVRAIREEYASGAGVLALARKHGVSHGTISLVVSGKTWKHVT